LIKADSSGNKIWDSTFGGADSDIGFCVRQTSDGGYIITGSTYSYGVNGDIWLIKTDDTGDKDWDKTHGGTGVESGFYGQEDVNGGYVITGSTTSYGAGGGDVWLVRTNQLGNLLYDKTYGGTDDEAGYCIQQAIDGGYVITGYTKSYGAGCTDIWLIKTYGNGDKIWDREFGGAGDERGYCVRQTTDRGYILTGYTNSYGSGDTDVWLIKTGILGDVLWDETFGGASTERGHSVRQTSDGGYILTGLTCSDGPGSVNVWLIKTDQDGKQRSKMVANPVLNWLRHHPNMFPILKLLMQRLGL
jgi:hypothetical protein